MKRIVLYCLGDGFKKGDWLIEPHNDGINLIDPDDQVYCWIAHVEANERIELPSFWASVKNIGFKTKEGRTIPFAPDPKTVEKVRRYLDEAIMVQGESGVGKLKSGGWTGVAAGVGLAALGVLALWIMYLLPDLQIKFVGRILIFVIIFGVAGAFWGAASLLRYRKLMRIMRESDLGRDAEDNLGSPNPAT